MRIFRHYSGVPPSARRAVVALGNFDGVHLGHQAVIRVAGRVARERARPLAVLTFEPHPRQVFQPGAPTFRLTPFRIKARHLESLGVELLFVLHFDLEFSKIAAEDFVMEVLVRGLGATHVVVGYNFAFGHRRRGNVELLEGVAKREGFGVTCLRPVESPDGGIYASSLIRDYLMRGEPRRAAALLGRDWEIEGRVEGGLKLGVKLGFPTANLSMGEYIRPAYGVYAIRAGIDRGAETHWYGGAANVGRRPTIGADIELLEAHLFDFEGDLYGKHLRVALIERLRPEAKFADLDALRAQIGEDCRVARRILAASERRPGA